MRNAEYYRSRIAALEKDIRCFGAVGDDLERLAEYKSELNEIEEQVKRSRDTLK